MTTTATRPAPAAPRPRVVTPAAGGSESRRGPIDSLSADEVLALVAQLPTRSDMPRRPRDPQWAAAQILNALQQHPGQGWHDRWLTASADQGTHWLDSIKVDPPYNSQDRRAATVIGLADLLLCRLVLPSYDLLARFKTATLYERARLVFTPTVFTRLQRSGIEQGLQRGRVREGLNAITRVVLHTGRDVGELTADDMRELRHWHHRRRRSVPSGVYAGCDLLQVIGVLPPDLLLRNEARQRGQLSITELVDQYQIHDGPIREVLIRYLTERSPALDHTSLCDLASTVVGLFWSDIERHHPGIDTLDLPAEVAETWKQRLRFITTRAGERRPRKNYLSALGRVRAFYLDIAEWALQDPYWVPRAAPSPVRRSELVGRQKERNKTIAEMHQRVRERLPRLSELVDSAEHHHRELVGVLAAAKQTPLGQTFHHDGVTYLRTVYKSYASDPGLQKKSTVLAENIETGRRFDVARDEEDAFWIWAIIETLRHTGVRIEELLEITHLALVSYRLPDTGEVVPLLQIVPSKSNEERLLLISPELASVLATIVKRLRDRNAGTIPLVARYDIHEKGTGPPLPHLFQHQLRGWRPAAICQAMVHRMLADAINRANLRDKAGKTLRFTPHDFRRIFTTEAVAGGLPVHIASKLLGHHNMETVEPYLVVFQDDLIRTYRAFLDKRRAMRPTAEYREPTDEEWREFQQHFHLRKLELGTCGRPYGAHCEHEHACIRCPMLRVDPKQKARLAQISENLQDRITEARMNGWLGEVQGLQTSLEAARSKLTSLERTAKNNGRAVDLGVPTINFPD